MGIPREFEEKRKERQIRTVMYQYDVPRETAKRLIGTYGVDALLPWKHGEWGPEYGYMIYEMEKVIPSLKVYELDFERIKTIKEFLVRKWIPKVKPHPFFPDLLEKVEEKPKERVDEQLTELITKAVTPPYDRDVIRKWRKIVKGMVSRLEAELEMAIKTSLVEKMNVNVEEIRKKIHDLKRILREIGEV